MSFENCLKQISAGNAFDQTDLIPHLAAESIEKRAQINYRLAEAFVAARQYDKAKVFIDRSWIFSNYSLGMFQLYKHICENLQDYDALREAYKRLGIRYANEGRLSQALTAFNNWQYVYATYWNVDRYQYDSDVLDAVATLARSHPLQTRNQPPLSLIQGRKIRLAYLVYGASHENSVLVKILHTFAKFHDRTAFDVGFFVPEHLTDGQKARNSQLLELNGVKFFVAPWSTVGGRLTTVANKIKEFRPDILITTAGLADFEHYFLALLRPAPLVVSLLQGPPQQFTARGFDHAISWSRHPLIDSPVDASLIRIGVHLPEADRIPTISRRQLGIPDGALTLMSAGRHVKFQSREFWRNLIALLRAHSNTCYVVVGAERSQISSFPHTDTDLPDAGRIIFLGWRSDCLSVMKCADIVIDTYPSGGGHVLIDAMALGKPFVSFTNDYMHAFDQTDWSVAEEFVAIPELIVPRGDFEKFKEVTAKLISDTNYRNRMGEECQQQIRLNTPTEKQGVVLLEQEYLRLLKTKGHGPGRLTWPDRFQPVPIKSDLFENLVVVTKKLIKRVLN